MFELKSVFYAVGSFVVGMAITVSGGAMAEKNQQKHRRHGPPLEAVQACESLVEGDACAFSGRRGDVSGTCFLPSKENAMLACKPEGSGGRKDRLDEEGNSVSSHGYQ